MEPAEGSSLAEDVSKCCVKERIVYNGIVPFTRKKSLCKSYGNLKQFFERVRVRVMTTFLPSRENCY